MTVGACGSRLVMPQLQLEMEVFRNFGFFWSNYSTCRVPHALSKSQTLRQQMLKRATRLDRDASAVEELQTRRAWFLSIFWAFGVGSILLTFMMGASVSKQAAKLKSRKPWRMRVGFALSWIHPIMSMFRSTPASDIDFETLNGLQPDLKVGPYAALQTYWHEEIAAKGSCHADLTTALRRFVGVRQFSKIMFSVLAQMLLEIVGASVAVDVVLNYLRWFSVVTEGQGPHRHTDKLGPSLMIILLGFGLPMLSRYFSVLANMRDGYACARISTGLLGLVHEKALMLPSGAVNTEDDSGEPSSADANQLLACDATRVWRGVLKSYAQLACAPLCAVLLLKLLSLHFGPSAVLAACAALVLGGFCSASLLRSAQYHNMRFLSYADLRAVLTKETLMNARGLRGASSQVMEALVQRLRGTREKELKAKLQYSLTQGYLAIPLTLLPLLLVCFTIAFHVWIAGQPLRATDLFVCMQVLTCGSSCCAIFSAALQRVLTLPNSVRRIEHFLKRPEQQQRSAAQQTQMRHYGAPLARLNGSFSNASGKAPVLHDMDLELKRGELVAIVGATSSGKTSLLRALLGELHGVGPEAHADAPQHVAYCAQTPWICDGLLHDNVVLDEVPNRQRFETALASAGLALPEAPEQSLESGTVESAETTSPATATKEAGAQCYFPYFLLWSLSTMAALVLGIMNVDWSKTPVMKGMMVVFLQNILHWSVIELPLQTIATFVVAKRKKLRRAPAGHLSVCLNYNLLAVSPADIETCFANMYDAYMGSVAENVSAVLVSATSDPVLKDYELRVCNQCRERIFSELVHEGLVWAGLAEGCVDPGRRERIWAKYESGDRQEFVQIQLHNVCSRFANEFMVLHRISRVLRKCGQYQDLMLLSEGRDRAYTYCDEDLYGANARRWGEPLFHPSRDVDAVRGRRFDYTLVLDSDTKVVPGSVFTLLEIAAAHPDRVLIQPALEMDVAAGDSIFAHLEGIRQMVNAPLTEALAAVLGQSGFYGKGLIQNRGYVEKCIGTPKDLVEIVPINLLSHDTYEAMVVEPLYAGEVQLLEAPCKNYMTWDIREARWHRGELLLAMYFFPSLVGAPLRFLQKLWQKNRYVAAGVRTQPTPGQASLYLAYAALRQMALKPALVLYVVSMDYVQTYYRWTPLIIVMVMCFIVPKFAVGSKITYKAMVLETCSSILQFTPEAVVGSVRVLRSLRALLSGHDKWVPQRAVEEECEQRNPFAFAASYLWQYPAFAVAVGLVVAAVAPEARFLMWMLGTLITLPVYAGFTALHARVRYSAFPYFTLWNFFALLAIALAVVNVDWQRTPFFIGMLVVAVQGLLHWSVMEIPLQALAALFCDSPGVPARKRAGNLTLCFNYNLLSVGTADVDDCFKNMFEAFMGNISENVSSCLVSATNDPELKQYELKVRDDCRAKIIAELRREGQIWAGFSRGKVDEGRARRFWSKYSALDRNVFVQEHLDQVCQNVAKEFMVIHRVSRVLRKCGQYQDLMLLSEGYRNAFTYCDKALYGSAGRPPNEPLFEDAVDVENVVGRKFDYTLVLDADTMVEPNSVFSMLDVGAGNPDRAIIQPAIQMSSEGGDAIFMHVEAMRQVLNERMTKTLTALLGQCGFYGKGLIKNSLYISKCLGTPENPLEVVPINVLSHDTFEASVLQPLYAHDLTLKEAPCGNYVTWDIRERRWNRGELVLAMYFFPRFFGKPIRWLQTKMQGREFEQIGVRNTTEISPVASYIAHAALRMMFLKPVLVTYIVLLDFCYLYYQWTPFLTAMFLIIVFPKIVTCTEDRVKPVIWETIASVLQFTPECVVGTIRVLRAFKAHLTGNAMWVPQRAVEEDFEKENPFLLSLSYLWYYPCFAAVSGILVSTFLRESIFIMWMLGTLFTLPLYAGFTAIKTPQTTDISEQQASSPAAASAAATDVDLSDEEDAPTRGEKLPEVYIGASGSLLSATEKAQVAFARAAYHRRAELVLLDDPFAALDKQARAHLTAELARGSHFRERTRVVALPMPAGDEVEHLANFDRVLLLEKGRLVAQGAPSAVLPGAFESLEDKSTPKQPAANEGIKTRPVGELASAALLREREPGVISTAGAGRELLSLLGAGGGVWRLLVAVALVAVLRALAAGQLLVLGAWADGKETRSSATMDSPYLCGLLVSIVCAGILHIILNYFILAFSNSVSQWLYDRVLGGLLRLPIFTFWDRQPVGRIMNRLSGDLFTLDASPVAGFPTIVSFIVSVFFHQLYCFYVLPTWLTVTMYVVMGSFIFWSFRSTTTMQLSSLLAQSACHEKQWFANLPQSSLRAFKSPSAQIAQFQEVSSASIKADFYGVTCMKQWLVFRLCFCLSFQCTICMLSGILSPGSVHFVTLCMIILLTFCSLQQLEQFVDALIGSIGVGLAWQRILEYSDEPMSDKADALEASQKVQAAIAADVGSELWIQGLSVRKRSAIETSEATTVVLQPGQWMGVVGSDLAKSDLLLALAGLVEASHGTALMGGIVLAGAGAADTEVVRQIVRYVPNQPMIFDGTLRFNVDPSGKSSDEEIQRVLACAQLPPTLSLDMDLRSSQGNLSSGQQQLVCLARALLDKPAVLLLDESLSTVDSDTCKLVYRAIAAASPKAIVLAAEQQAESVAGFEFAYNADTGVLLKQR
eukprot:TRINITY_DN3227_c0_g2_i1.p1 TRINITY_DN3227_c0_g2~~TRINITY_DN3227_c0_g2_i1.p1  ORF type:complete len:2828 (-),score=613.09 TRINITY_DN3227_c0_g2_i1:118-8028(-)